MTTVAALPYTSDLQKTAAVIPETIEILRQWEPGLSPEALSQRVIASGGLGRVSTVRVHDIVRRSFKQRFLEPDDGHARLARTALGEGLGAGELRDLLFLAFVRTYRVAYDFLVERYWPLCYAGHAAVTGREIVSFLAASAGTDRNPHGWSKAVTERVGRNLGKALADFGLFEAGRTTVRRIRPWQPTDFLVTCLLVEQHARGAGDTALLSLPEWAAFGMRKDDVLDRCRRLGSVTGPFVFQYSGEIAQFSFRHADAQEFIREYAAT